MKGLFRIQKVFIRIIAFFVMAAGISLTILATFHFIMAFSHVDTNEIHDNAGRIAIGLLHAVDLYLVAIVFFVLSIGVLVLFAESTTSLPLKLPNWLHVESFVELKIILWEAILTALVVDYIARLAERKINGLDLTAFHLVQPAAILLISLALFFVKKEGK